MRPISRNIAIIGLMSIMILPLSAQKGIEDGSKHGHGEDSVNCIKNLSLYREFAKQGPKGYGDAMPNWKLVYNECPASTKNIYIDGVKLYNNLIDNEKDPERKAALMDTLRMIYDQRIKYFKQPGTVLGRKAVDILRHPEYRENPVIIEECYGYLKKSLELLKNRSSMLLWQPSITSAISLYQNGTLTDQQMIEDYSVVADIIDYQLGKKPDNTQLKRVKNATDAQFLASGAPTCSSLLEFFQTRYDAKKEDVSFLRKAVVFMGRLECEDDPFFSIVAEELYAKEPSADSAFGLAKLFLKKKEYSKSIGYYKEAIEREEDPLKKADYYYQLAFITNAEMDQAQQARTYALEAIKLKPEWGEPYILIGDTYAGAKDCFNDEFERTTIYWAAVDKFIRAKSVDSEVLEKADERISTYSKYFPDVETIFFYSLAEGDSYTVGCWINETTKVRAR